jgi:hypothetical protein
MTTWTIINLTCKPLDNELTNVVYQVHWRYTKTTVINDVTYNAFNIGITEIDAPDVNSFIAFENLTKTQVVAWIESKLGETYITEMNTRLDQDIQAQSNRIVLQPPFED